MSDSTKIARIKWACRRGMLELDFILGSFLEQGFLNMDDQQQDNLLIFLENPDPDLYSWLMGFAHPTVELDKEMTKLIRQSELQY